MSNNSFEQQLSTPPQPEKLPSITMLPSLDNRDDASSSAAAVRFSSSMPPPSYSTFLPPSTGMIQNPLYNQNVVSPPLTPAVSPSSILLDSMQFKRKFSVDVGPFGFNSGHQQEDVDDAYRRASVMSMNEQEAAYNPRPTDYTSFLNSNMATDSMMYNNNSNSNEVSEQPKATGRRNSTRNNQKAHKHVCKYPFCGWSFKRYEHLKRHMLVHTGERPHVCQFPGCGKSFSRSDNFHAHCRTHMKKANQRRSSQAKKPNSGSDRKLSTCSTSTASSTTAIVPMAYPETSEQYTAAMAPPATSEQYQFTPQPPMFGSDAPSLLNHEASSQPHSFFLPSPTTDTRSTGLQYYPQQQAYSLNYTSQPAAQYPAMAAAAAVAATTNGAPKAYNNNSNNNNYIQRRSSAPISGTNQQQQQQQQQKSHVCPIMQCQRRFKRLEHLKRHMRIHTLERPFACTYPGCHKTFSRSDNLSQHMKTHQRHEERRRRQQQQQQQDFSVSSLSPSSTEGISWNGPC
ncbi:hypothetical protein BJV82DRAFT_552611 [Fennellomyces sp. T-0311]|nr:hypothetical protein BJV82DRAFT_552611 [Fennellomyces sp. T-0311]